MVKKMILLVLSFLLLTSSAFAGGGWTGNGGELNRDQDNVWFLGGNRTVTYCIKNNIDFYSSDPEVFHPSSKNINSIHDVRKVIKDSLSQWIHFFKKYGLHESVLGGQGSDMSFHDKKPRNMALRFKETPCTQNTDLVFMLGIKNKIIENALQKTPNLIAAALRKDYNHKTFWNKGIIWISKKPLVFNCPLPDYKSVEPRMKKNTSCSRKVKWQVISKFLTHVVLHELGHVFGMPHNSVHVMKKDISNDIQTAQCSPNYINKIGTLETELNRFMYRPGDTFRIIINQKIDYRTVLHLPTGDIIYYPEETYVHFSNPAKSLPKTIRNFLKLKNHETFKLTLTLGKPATLNSDYSVKLRFETESGKVFTVTGNFKNVARNPVTGFEYDHKPGIYTQWKNKHTTPYAPRGCIQKKTDYSRQLFQSSQTSLKSGNGFFKFGNETFAATLQLKNNLMLQLMNPSKGTWFSIPNFSRFYYSP